MGNQALTSALLQLAPTLRRRPVFHELVLTAPDIDTDMFSNDIAPAILGVARRSTLYASSQDIALDFSRRLHGYPRAGDSGEEIVLVNGMDSIDVSAVSTDFLGHGYYGSNDSVLSDMHYLIKGLQISDRHGLRQQSRNAQPYWVFRP